MKGKRPFVPIVGMSKLIINYYGSYFNYVAYPIPGLLLFSFLFPASFLHPGQVNLLIIAPSSSPLIAWQ